jgi:CRISPR-associated endoribonuclease Cas6
MLDFLQNLQLTTYQITLQAQTEGKLPGFLGSTLRGALGHALWRANCRDSRSAKPFTCGQNCTCVVGRMWLPRGEFPEGYGGRYQNAPKPFMIQAVYNAEPQFYRKGDTLTYSLSLVGQVEKEFFRRILPAIEEASKKLGSQHTPFRVIQVTEVLAPVLKSPSDENSVLTMQILTPLSMYEKEKLPEELRFGLIVKQLLERLRNLAYLYSNADWVDDDTLLAYAARAEHEVDIKQQILNIVKIYREGDKDPVVGYLGKVTYSGKWQTWLPLLSLAEQIHLGKLTDMGFGHIKLNF